MSVKKKQPIAARTSPKPNLFIYENNAIIEMNNKEMLLNSKDVLGPFCENPIAENIINPISPITDTF